MVLLSAVAGLAIAEYSAPVLGLVDKPDARKVHEGHIPLVGGISIWVAMSALLFLKPDWLPAHYAFWTCITMLLIVGVLDDRFMLPVFPRIVAQAVAALIMMHADLWLSTFGELFPGYVVTLGAAGYFVTLVAIWASINAFNMVDGIDGLLGSLSCVTFGSLGVLFYWQGDNEIWKWCFALVLSLMPYMAANFGLLGGMKHKVFMGDAGSTVIGFAAIWVLVVATQSDWRVIAPVTALWLIALPLMDLCAVSVRRLRSGVSPFHPDRGHIHHIIMKCGFSSRQTLLILFSAALVCVIVGILFEHLQVPNWISLLSFLLLFAAWLKFSSHIYRR